MVRPLGPVRSARPAMPGSNPRALQFYVAFVVAVGLACVAFASAYSSLTFRDHVFASVALIVLAICGQLLRIRLHYGNHVDDWNFFEVSLAAIFALSSQLDVVVVTAIATAVGLSVQKLRDP